MSVQIAEFSLWCRVTVPKLVAGFKIFGFTIVPDEYVNETTELVRVYPSALGLDAKVSPDVVIDKLLSMGYCPVASEVVDEIIRCRTKSSKKGYIIVPLTSGSQMQLVIQNGIISHPDHCLLVGTVQNAGYAVIAARPV